MIRFSLKTLVAAGLTVGAIVLSDRSGSGNEQAGFDYHDGEGCRYFHIRSFQSA